MGRGEGTRKARLLTRKRAVITITRTYLWLCLFPPHNISFGHRNQGKAETRSSRKEIIILFIRLRCRPWHCIA